jgi:lysozyme
MSDTTSDNGITQIMRRECKPPLFDFVLTAYDDA